MIQVITGTALATIYNSSPDGAYQSLEFIPPYDPAAEPVVTYG
jgi:quinol-cytochrome oxidoreductase complex cytochrome b subunit